MIRDTSLLLLTSVKSIRRLSIAWRVSSHCFIYLLNVCTPVLWWVYKCTGRHKEETVMQQAAIRSPAGEKKQLKQSKLSLPWTWKPFARDVHPLVLFRKMPPILMIRNQLNFVHPTSSVQICTSLVMSKKYKFVYLYQYCTWILCICLLTPDFVQYLVWTNLKTKFLTWHEPVVTLHHCSSQNNRSGRIAGENASHFIS